MKQARSVQIVTQDDAEPFAIMLEGDFTAEHQFGIKDLLRRIHIDPDGKLVSGRTTQAPTEFKVYQYKVAQKYYDETALKQRQKASQISAISTADYSVNCREQAIYAAQRYKTDEDLTGAWDDRNFKLLAWTSNGAEMLQKIVKASADGVLLVFLGNGGGNPFKPSGLVLAIASKVPASLQQTLNDADKNTIALEKAAAKTGIAKRIERSKHNEHFLKAYYALSPSWIEDERKARSKHPVMFWLNPTSQDRYQAGYYTVEELDEWIKGRGPVVKTKAA